jgi:hypothetical protein
VEHIWIPHNSEHQCRRLNHVLLPIGDRNTGCKPTELIVDRYVKPRLVEDKDLMPCLGFLNLEQLYSFARHASSSSLLGVSQNMQHHRGQRRGKRSDVVNRRCIEIRGMQVNRDESCTKAKGYSARASRMKSSTSSRFLVGGDSQSALLITTPFDM